MIDDQSGERGAGSLPGAAPSVGAEHPARDVLSAQLKRSILKRRAVQLARPIERPSVPPGQQYVLFVLGRERLACPIEYVDEVFQLKSVLTVPGTPPYVVGIVSIRGMLVTVVDLKHLLNLHEKSVMGSDRALIINGQGFQVAVLTDDVSGLEFIADEEIQRESPLVGHIPSSYVEGITRNGTIIVNCRRLFTLEALEVGE